MNTEEQQLISKLFDRMERATPPAMDFDAQRLIQERTGRFPDASYMLVQSVLVQDHALQQAAVRIRQLEDLVASTRRNGVGPAITEGSFLNGAQLLSPWTRGSVPSIEPDRVPQSQPVGPPPAAGSSGGFLASALSTASGVAGGVLLADGLRSLFGNGSGSGGLLGGLPGMPRASNDTSYAALDQARDEAQDARDDADEAHRELAEDDVALDDAQDRLDDQDDGSWSTDDTVDV